MSTMSTIRNLYRYPVKGLSPEPLAQVALRAGEGFPVDRAYALTNGSWTFDTAAYRPRPKTDFIALMDHAALASLATRFDDETGCLHVSAPDGRTLRIDVDDAQGRAELEGFIARHVGARFEGPPRFVAGEGFRFTDVSVLSHAMMNAVSLINLATVREIGATWGVDIDPLRFRANIYIDGVVPWEEASWLDRDVRIGCVRARVVMRTPRCAATNVNPVTAKRDLALPQTMMERYGHRELGVYLQLLEDGEIRPGDAVTPL
jgi:uncharacterized protein